MKPRLAVVFLKEIRDALRDRRTALMILVASVLTGPVTLILVASFVSGLEERASTLRVRIAGAENAPALVNFLERADVEIEKAPSDYLARVKEGALDAVIVVPEDFHERWLAHEEARVELVHDDSRTESGPATRQAERLLAAFNRETAYLRLMARGVSPSLNESTKVERVNTATPRQRGAVLLFLIPMFGILAPLLGGMTVAIDSTAGERERGSLEPLLANPVPARVFAIGKWLASWASATAVVTLTMAGFLAAATRNIGVLLWMLVMWEWLRCHGWRITRIHRAESWRGLWSGIKSDWVDVVVLAAIPLGLLLYMGFLQTNFSRPTAFIEVQAAWGRQNIGPVGVVMRELKALSALTLNNSNLSRLLNLVPFLGVLIMTPFIWRRLGEGYAIYVLVLLLVPAASALQSMIRYVLPMFPVFILLGWWGRSTLVDRALLTTFAVLLGALTAIYVNWVFVA